MRRYAAMDGYRGLFVLLVIAYHFGVTSLVGGWVGINHFFVFSGFLISRILIKERQKHGNIDIVSFYRRRARRVLPAMFVLVAAVLLHSAIFEAAQQKKQFAGDAFATLGFFLNWRLIGRQDAYFDQFGNPSPLRHAWTLSVEEQFYVIVPFLILALVFLTRSRNIRFLIAMALACVSAWWTAHIGYHSFEDQARLYYGTDTRAQALLVGVAFGFLFGVDDKGRGPRLPSRAVTSVLGFAGTVVSISAVFFLGADSAWVYNSGGVLLFALGASLMGWSSIDQRGLLINRIFGWEPLAFVGRISYGLYLYHWPIYLWVHIPGLSPLLQGVVQFVLAFGCAVVSFRYLEAPILTDGLRGLLPGKSLGWRRLCAWGSAAVLFVVAFAGWHTRVSGIPDDVPPLVAGTHPYVPHQPTKQFALVGDSVGSSFATGFDSSIYTDLALNDSTMLGCDLVPAPLVHDGSTNQVSSFCTQWRNTTTERLKNRHDTTMVIMGDAHFLTAHKVGQQIAQPRTAMGAQAIIMALDDWQRRAELAGVKQTIVVNLPCRRIDADKLAPSLKFFAAQGSDDASVNWVNRVIASWVNDHPNAHLADLHSRLCSSGFKPVVNGVQLYKDTLHFSPRAAAMIWTWLAPNVQKDVALAQG